jgi:RNA 3'-phosphate cyclase
METKPVEIDGSYKEGGGQILRTASAMAAIRGVPVHIYNIRNNRAGGSGLKTQHLRGLEAVSGFCSGRLEGAVLGSKEVTFRPGSGFRTGLNVNVETAGSTALILQSLMTAALAAGKNARIDIDGGATFGKFAPPLNYTRSVLLPLLKKMGVHSEILINRHGFYPSGGAKVVAIINACTKLRPLKLESQGCVRNIEGVSVASKNLKPSKVAERQTRILEEVLAKHGHDCRIRTEYVDSACTGSGVVVWAKTTRGGILGANQLMEYDGHTGEAISWECIRRLNAEIESEAAVDSWMADQILPYMALAHGRSVVSVPALTGHAETNIWAIKQFLPGIEFKVAKGDRNVTIECSGS